MQVYKLSKSILSIKNNPKEFLNGLTSNEMDKPHNAFVNVHGKIVATFDQLEISEDEYWIVIESVFESEVISHLSKYAALSGVVIETQSKQVFFDIDKDINLSDDDRVIDMKAGRLVITESEIESTLSEEQFTVFRLKNEMPVHGTDYKDDFLLNVSMSDYVSFTKGCFLGQEPISKVYNRSKPTWKLVVKNTNDCSDEEKAKMTSKAVDPETNEEMGFVFTRN